MTAVLLLLGGAAVGFVLGWVLASRRQVMPAPRAVPDLADELLASDTATHLAASVATEQSFDALCTALLERCADRVELPCLLAMREKPGAPAHVVAVSSGLDARLVGHDIPLDSAAGRAITDGIPVIGEEHEKVVNIGRRDRRRAVTGGIAIPVGQGPEVVGAVIALGVPAVDTHEAMDALMELVRRFAPVLVPAYAVSVATRRANTDELTGLWNRRALNRALGRIGIERAGLIMLDIDHFKMINDALGHPAGDAALKHVARIMKDTVRGQDIAARVGGEEFAIWLPDADLSTARDVADRLRLRVADAPFRAGGEERMITISCGVSAYPVPIGSVSNLISTADIALYRAKRGGRNKVVTSGDQDADDELAREMPFGEIG